MLESLRKWTLAFIVTGAYQNIGRANVVRLGQSLEMNVLAARYGEVPEEFVSEIRTGGARTLAGDIDLCARAAPSRIVADARGNSGRIDTVVNFAGAVLQTDLRLIIDAEPDGGISLKLHSARRLALAGWPHLFALDSSLIFPSDLTAFTSEAALAAVSKINATIVALATAFCSTRRIGDERRHRLLRRVNFGQPVARMTGSTLRIYGGEIRSV